MGDLRCNGFRGLNGWTSKYRGLYLVLHQTRLVLVLFPSVDRLMNRSSCRQRIALRYLFDKLKMTWFIYGEGVIAFGAFDVSWCFVRA